MADKQTLYELLGLSDKASPADIQQAYAALRLALDAQPENEEKHNRIAILTDARDLLLDRRQRAGYDRHQRDRREGERRQALPAPPTRWLKPTLASLLIAGAAYAAGRYMVPAAAPGEPRSVANAVAPAPTSRVTSASDSREADALAADIAAQLPPAAAMPAQPASTSASAPVAQPAAQAAPIEAPQPSAERTIAESTYLIIGGGGQGTGVAIESDKLLTNCHVIAPNVHKGPLLATSAVTGASTRITHAAFLITEDACIVHAPGLNARPIGMGNTARLTRGTQIYNLGFAKGRLTFSPGTMLGVINRRGQNYLVSNNYCDNGVSGGPLVDASGELVGLTSGGTRDRKFCISLTVETARRVLDQTLIVIDGFPTDYLTNLQRNW
ncbi:MAG: trypsin-like peptidase domain-containing protein [Rhodocyclales bacterium]|nr:trypsin-like peptidase domain-containing protein [Rhodocyclales bacterium]